MAREQFLRIWDGLPDLKRAELIDGTVFVASPVSAGHGFTDFVTQGWLMSYAARTPGCRGGANMTWLMLESAPQPDCCLTSQPVRLGGKHNNLAVGAPELIIEVTWSSHSHDYGPKRALYQRAGVKEYLTIDEFDCKVVWRRLVAGSYRNIAPGPDGIIKSAAFPGLWLDPAALWDEEHGATRILNVLDQGLLSPEHAAFVKRRARAGAKT